jgi:NTE family protein
MSRHNEGLALVLSGGGARAAYQAGFLKCLARNFPDLNIPIITGVSAGAINAAFLANHEGGFAEAVADLSALWLKLSVDQIFCVNTWKLKAFAITGTNYATGQAVTWVMGDEIRI